MTDSGLTSREKLMRDVERWLATLTKDPHSHRGMMSRALGLLVRALLWLEKPKSATVASPSANAWELLRVIRQAIFAREIPVNRWNGRCYIQNDVAYFVTPNGFKSLAEKGLLEFHPEKLPLYLDALSTLPCVRKTRNGKIVRAVELRPGARPLGVIAIETRGLFGDTLDEARKLLGTWTYGPIRDLTQAA